MSLLRARTKRHAWHVEASLPLNVKGRKVSSSREITIQSSGVRDTTQPLKIAFPKRSIWLEKDQDIPYQKPVGIADKA